MYVDYKVDTTRFSNQGSIAVDARERGTSDAITRGPRMPERAGRRVG